jgi:2-polyprenyl-3-methyl-5-hydroxy-6-metoxy-1,4-benzoquinol methylase
MSLVCPLHKQSVIQSDSHNSGVLVAKCGCQFPKVGGRTWKFLHQPESGTTNVREFYEKTPFPNYNDFESFGDFFNKGLVNPFTMRIARAIRENSKVLEVGCGTGQLINFLSAINPGSFTGFDLTGNSLALADKFAENNKLNVNFIQGDIFSAPFEQRSFDFVISLGVLHHTINCEKAIEAASSLVTDRGEIVIGLYNTFGRLWTDLRRIFLRSNKKILEKADWHLRKKLSSEKRDAWVQDQYFHPLEKKYTLKWTIDQLKKNGFNLFSTIPAGLDPKSSYKFNKYEEIDWEELRVGEINMLFDSHGAEGGLHVVWAKRI